MEKLNKAFVSNNNIIKVLFKSLHHCVVFHFFTICRIEF